MPEYSPLRYTIPDHLTRDMVAATYEAFPGFLIAFLKADTYDVLFIGKDGDVMSEYITGYPVLDAYFPDGEPTRVRIAKLVDFEDGIVPTLISVGITVFLVADYWEQDERLGV